MTPLARKKSRTWTVSSKLFGFFKLGNSAMIIELVTSLVTFLVTSLITSLVSWASDLLRIAAGHYDFSSIAQFSFLRQRVFYGTEGSARQPLHRASAPLQG